MGREMKDSCIEWIGEIPEKWEVSIIKRNFYIINGSTPKSDNNNYWGGNIVWITPAEMSENIIEIFDSKRKITTEGLESCGTAIVPPNSIIVSNRAPIGQICITGVELCTNQGCKSLVSKINNYEKYIYYFLITQTNTLNMLGRGTTFLEISTYDLANLKIPYPTISEQQAIADFLDNKCSLIDSTIEKEKAVIEKLKLYKKSIITEAVTKGLDPNVKMKTSGIEWIGGIPEGWSVTNLGYRSRMIVPMRDKPTEFGGEIPWIRIEDIDGKYIEDSKSEQRVSQELIKKMNLKVYPVGTVLCTCSCSMGTTVIVNRPLVSNQTFIGIVPTSSLDSIFLYYVMNANSERLQFLGEGAIQLYLSRHDFEHLRLALPSIEEQQAIADYLDVKCEGIDNVINGKQKLIKKLSDYKKSLIYEYVTGKKEVI